MQNLTQFFKFIVESLFCDKHALNLEIGGLKCSKIAYDCGSCLLPNNEADLVSKV